MTDEYHRDTKLVRGGLKRTEFQETSEALFLNSGYVYDSAEEAAAARTAKRIAPHGLELLIIFLRAREERAARSARWRR